MLLSAEVVRHVPKFRARARRHIAAMLDILTISAPPDIRTKRCTANRAADRRYISAVSAADLMTENAADDSACNRAGDVRAATIHMLPLDPAALLWWTDNRTHRRHVCFEYF